MSSQKLWYGFLEAGEKSSPVIRDLSEEPDTSDNIFMFNVKAGQILRYKASIVASKLRELKPAEEKEYGAEMEAARKEFKGSSNAVQPTAATVAKPPKKTESKMGKNDDDELDDIDSDDIDIDLDIDIDVDMDSDMIDLDSEIPDEDNN